jgi:hypothetical protein
MFYLLICVYLRESAASFFCSLFDKGDFANVGFHLLATCAENQIPRFEIDRLAPQHRSSLKRLRLFLVILRSCSNE